MEVTEKSAISHGWRGILVGRDLLKENMGWVVGDGSSISVWYDPWLSLSAQLRPTGPATEASMNLTVADLFHENSRTWDREKIQRLLPQWTKTIMTIKPSITGAPDKQVWLSTPSGEYTTKSGYHTAIARKTEEPEQNTEDGELEWFKGVWNLHTSPKIKMFLWKLFQQAMPVGEILIRRGIPTDGLCKRCGTLESIDHLFLHCPYAEEIWRTAPFATTVVASGLIDLKSVWLNLYGRSCLPPTGIVSGQLAPWILWQIWCARNQLVFEGKTTSAEETMTKAMSMAREWTNSQVTDKKKSFTTKSPPRIRIEENCTVVNTDAAWRATTQDAGLGWTIKTQQREYEFTSYNQCVGSALSAEGLALREALLRCRAMELTRLHCCSDSATLIKAINSEETPPELYEIISDIESICRSFDQISFSWISRGQNNAADKLAKQCLVEGEVFMADT